MHECVQGQEGCNAHGVEQNMQQVLTAMVQGCNLTRSYAAQRHAQLAPAEQIADQPGGFPVQPSCWSSQSCCQPSM